MRTTKRNIARKTKAANANRTTPAKRKTEPFASAEGHDHHSKSTELHHQATNAPLASFRQSDT